MNCGNPLENISNSKQIFTSGSVPQSFDFPTTVEVACMIGYKWTNGFTKQNLSCLPNGRWSALSPCTSMLFSLILLLIFYINYN